jgi:predicted permease
VDPGFRPEGIVAVSLDLERPSYPKDRLPQLHLNMLDRIRDVPGVISAAHVGIVPISGSGWNNRVRPDGSATESKNCNFNRVGPGYFKTMGTGLVAGRDFSDRDTLSAPKVAIVNAEFVKQIFGGANPLGRSFRVEGEAGKPDPIYEIVGVVRNTKYFQLREDFIPIAFLPMAQDDDPGPGTRLVVRAVAPMSGVMSGIKSVVASVNPQIGIRFRILSVQLTESLMRDRLMATLSGAFGLLAGFLATLGLYGVIAYMVERRRSEIGVRMALGADRARVLRLVLREAGLLLIVGLAAGTGLSIWAGQGAAALLFGVQASDPAILLGASALLACVALAASYWPARRAARLDPMIALRQE